MSAATRPAHWTAEQWEDLNAEVNPDVLDPELLAGRPADTLALVRPDTLARVRTPSRTDTPDVRTDAEPDAPASGRPDTPDVRWWQYVRTLAMLRGVSGFRASEVERPDLNVSRTRTRALLAAAVARGELVREGGEGNRATRYYWAGKPDRDCG